MSTTMSDGEGGAARAIRVGVKPGQWGWTFDQLTAAWERAEAFGIRLLWDRE